MLSERSPLAGASSALPAGAVRGQPTRTSRCNHPSQFLCAAPWLRARQVRNEFSKPEPRPGYGCDGSDSDSSNGVGDCGEDPFPPATSPEAAVTGAYEKWFTKEGALLKYVKGAVVR